MLFRRQREPGWMGVRIEGDRIDVAHVVREPRPAVLRCESYQLSGDVVESLKRLRKALRLDRFRITTLVAAAECQLHQVESPNVPAPELRQAIRWSVKDLIDYPIESAIVDVAEIPSAPNVGRARALFAVTAPASVVAKRAEPFRGADVALAAIDIPEMAQRNLCCLFEPENRAVALLAFYPEGALLTITGRGELLVARRIEVPLERLLGKDVAQTSQFLDRIALELQRSTDNFDRQFSFIALSKLLLANVPETTGLKETLKANLDVAVEDMNLAQVLDVGRVPELMNGDRQSQCLGVLGAALRTSAASPAVAVAA